MRCQDCAFWTRNEYESVHQLTKLNNSKVGSCSNPKFVYINWDEKTPDDGLGYWDYESYKAGFETGENFGCVNFKEREKNEPCTLF